VPTHQLALVGQHPMVVVEQPKMRTGPLGERILAAEVAVEVPLFQGQNLVVLVDRGSSWLGGRYERNIRSAN
jgi:hypothetical protein